jgi:beta-glucosidase
VARRSTTHAALCCLIAVLAPAWGCGTDTPGFANGSRGGLLPDGGPPPVTWPSAACKAQTASLLSQMSRLQKAAQMVAAVDPADSDVTANAYGSVLSGGSNNPTTGNTPQDWATMTDGYAQDLASTPLSIPPIYAIDAVHGNSHPSGTVIFPHAIGLASSRDAALVTQVAQMTALESTATGITMTYFPQASVAWDARWGRFYETFSEDVDWATEMITASVIGLQGAMGLGTGTPGMIACAKHWAGDGQGTAGKSFVPGWGGVVDRSDIEVDLPTMQKYGMAAYLPAIRAGLGCIMASDTTWNGTFVTSSSQMITDLLKGTYGFQGLVISDWNANVNAGGIEPTINAGIDMLMEPVAPPGNGNWQQAVQTIANSSVIPEARIDDAVARILNTKCQAGLFNFRRDATLLASVGSPAHRALGRKAVAQSLVVLQNDHGVLPPT